jgi:DNA ligase (NAD+)
MSKKEFEKLNKERKEKGESLFANPRNVAAGSIRQLDSKIAASRKLDSFVYDLSWLSGKLPPTQFEELKLLAELGFKVNKYYKYCRNIDEVVGFWGEWEKKKSSLPYGVDGVVVKLDRRDWQEKLGYTGKSPRFAVAFKFAAEQSTTVIEDIKVQVGRTGTLTPVAILKPVGIGGVIVSRATLHNEEEIKKLDVRIGDTVILQRSGDVIPDIVGVMKDLRTAREKKFKMPEKCPMCDAKITQEKGSPIARCSNRKCQSRHRRSLYYFASKRAFDIDGLGPKIIDALLDNGLIQDAADFFDLKEGDIVPLERFAEKSAENLVKAINKKKEISLERFLIALGIMHVGEGTARDLAEEFGSMEELEKALLERLMAIKNVGEKVGKSVFDWFKDEHNKKFLKKLLARIKIINAGRKTGGIGKLKGLKFVLTGTLSSMSRDEAKEKIRELGGEAIESVSKNIDYVVLGENPGSKYEKAKELGVKTIDEREFLNMLK